MLLTLCPVFICSLILLLPVSKTPLSNHETHRAKGWGKKVKMVKVIQHTDWDPFQIQPWRQSNAGMFKHTTEAWPWQGLSSGVRHMLGEETSAKALRLSVILRKQNVTWFLFVSSWKQMFLCLSFLGLISLLSFSEFSLFICKWKTSERLVSVGVGVGRRLKCLFSKPQGSPFEKAPSLSQCFCLYDFELKGWSNSFRRLSCLTRGLVALFIY